MKVEPKGLLCQELQQLVYELLETTNANELSETLGVMQEVFIQHAPVEKSDLANFASQIYRLTKFFFNLQALKDKSDGRAILVSGEKQKCMHN